MVISYVTFFFAAAGGMIGVANLAGSGWAIAAVILFLIMAVLAFVQRAANYFWTALEDMRSFRSCAPEPFSNLFSQLAILALSSIFATISSGLSLF